MVLHPTLTHGCLCVCAHRCIFIPTYVRTHALLQHPHDSVEPAKPNRSSVVCALCLLPCTLSKSVYACRKTCLWIQLCARIQIYSQTYKNTKVHFCLCACNCRAGIHFSQKNLFVCLSCHVIAGLSCQFGINSRIYMAMKGKLFCVWWGRGRWQDGGRISLGFAESNCVFPIHLNYCSWASHVTKQKLCDLSVGFCAWFLSFLSFLVFPSLLKSSVEAQCGLVLNGQGGVIRRGKRLQILASISSCKHTSLSISPCLSLPHCLE